MWIRLSLSESPAFQKMKAEGKTSKAPLTESFGQWKNLKIVILALVGLTAGQAVVWYSGQFYALFFLTQQLKVDNTTANLMIAASLLIGTPFFVIFGTLSDKIGRKPIIMAGCLLAVVTYFPVFKMLAEAANPDLARAQATAAVTVTADPATCSFQGNPVAREIDFRSSCDIAKRYLAQNSVSYENVAGAAGSKAIVKIGDKTIERGHRHRRELEVRHPHLYDPDRRMVKPPVVQAAGMLRAVGRGVDTTAWSWLCDQAGQMLFEPPNVSGWDDTRWLDTATFRARWQMAAHVCDDARLEDVQVSGKPAELVRRASRFWAGAPLSRTTRNALERYAASAMRTADQEWKREAYPALTENALRMLIAVSPDYLTS